MTKVLFNKITNEIAGEFSGPGSVVEHNGVKYPYNWANEDLAAVTLTEVNKPTEDWEVAREYVDSVFDGVPTRTWGYTVNEPQRLQSLANNLKAASVSTTFEYDGIQYPATLNDQLSLMASRLAVYDNPSATFDLVLSDGQIIELRSDNRVAFTAAMHQAIGAAVAAYKAAKTDAESYYEEFNYPGTGSQQEFLVHLSMYDSVTLSLSSSMPGSSSTCTVLHNGLDLALEQSDEHGSLGEYEIFFNPGDSLKVIVNAMPGEYIKLEAK